MSATTGIPGPSSDGLLSTLNRDGSRRWLSPRLSSGVFLNRRRVVGYALMGVFTVTPYLKVAGKPPLLFDLPAREFTFFGTTFLPTDTLLLALLVLAIFVAIFLLTALFGRVWCGWGCPQTVYMELLFRPVERLFDGASRGRSGSVAPNLLRRAGKYLTFLAISVYLAHTFLSYFVGVDRLAVWVRSSPFDHPTAFLVMAATTGLMMLDFCYLREQVCTLMCPYGRFQSVLLDRQSLIIGYDVRRGEPRGRRNRGAPDEALGDCVDCGMCVTTCPTGIDIRAGLQMECIACAQCIDACDRVMDKLKRPRGLIRYSSEAAIETGRSRWLRPRVLLYPLLLALVLGLFGWTLAGKGSADVAFLRNRNVTYRLLDSGDVANVVQVKITNRAQEGRLYSITIAGVADVSSPDLPLALSPGQSASATVRVVLPRERFERGRAELDVRVSDGVNFERTFPYHVLGPLYGGTAATSP